MNHLPRFVRSFVLLAACLYFRDSLFGAPQDQEQSARVAWVAEALKRMQTIQPGMTRMDLLAFFNTEGGISNRFQRTYVSRDCPYFKIDVGFQAAAKSDRKAGEDDSQIEDGRDVITKMSRPYLQFSILD